MHIMLTLIAVASLMVSFIATIVAVSTGNPKPYWLAVGSLYIFSMLAGFSYGQLTIAFVLILFLLAIGSSIKPIKNGLQFAAWFGAGILVSFFAVSYVDDRWLFFPMTLIS
ncbi:hypothetical protein [Indiicoccus explosivorum]|uniref:hypothetical protein n=1 Tax=Indiicoccus explosivorum TaxID=1917864 RepID=UPI000B437479|nr:hypothetical protein [Indiicoccus explosivorum]